LLVLEKLPQCGVYIAVFFDVRHFLAARLHHSEPAFQRRFRPGVTPSDDETVTSVRASRRRTFAQAAAQRFVASISQESVPGTSRHALRHHRLRRCAARPAALTGWALLAGRHPLWLPYGGLLELATSAVRASARGLLSLGPQIAHKSVSLPSARFFSSAARGRAPFGAERFFVRGGAPKMTAGTYNKHRKTQLAAAVLEIKEP
jgi:hypothetical protein